AMDVIENKVRLPIVGQQLPERASLVDSSSGPSGKLADVDVEAELKKFELEEMAALGIEPGREHWRDDVPTKFTKDQRIHTTVLVGGLTMAHDVFIQHALRGIGYKVMAMDVPDNAALTFGKEFGNRGQCNPTYFTVWHLIQ